MRYTLAELEAMPTLAVGQADDLKVDDGTTRTWLSRVGITDGVPYDNQVSVEELIDGAWVTVSTYEAL